MFPRLVLVTLLVLVHSSKQDPNDGMFTTLLETVLKSPSLTDCNLHLFHDYLELPATLQEFLQRLQATFKPLRIQHLQEEPTVLETRVITMNSSKSLPVWQCLVSDSHSINDGDLGQLVTTPPCVLHVIAVESHSAPWAIQSILNSNSHGLDARRFLLWPRGGKPGTFLQIPRVAWLRFKVEVHIVNEKVRIFTECGWWPDGLKHLQLLEACSAELQTGLPQDIFFDYTGDFRGKTLQFYNLYGWRRVSGALRHINDTRKWPNFHYRYLEALAQFLNVKSEVYIGPMKFFFEHHQNGTCEGYVGDFLQSDTLLLIFYVPISDVAQASKIVQPLNPFYTDTFSFFTRLPVAESSWKALVNPFATCVWELLLFTLFGTSTFLSIILVLHSSCSPHHAFIMGIEAVLRMLLEEDLPSIFVQTPSNALRLTLAPMMFGLLVLSAFYKSKLSSFLTVPEMEELPQTFQDLAKSNWEWILYDDFFLEALQEGVNTLPNGTLTPIIAHVAAAPPVTLGAETCLNMTLRQTSPERACVGYDYESTAWAYMNFSDIHGRILLQRSKPMLDFAVTAAVHKRSPHRHIINHAFQHIHECGLNLKWWKDMHQGFVAIGKEAAKQKLTEDKRFWQGDWVEERMKEAAITPLNNSTLRHAGKLLGLGWGLATAVLLLEFLIRR